MKRMRIVASLMLLMVAGVPASVAAQSEISQLNVVLRVNFDASVDVQERITYEFGEQAVNQFSQTFDTSQYDMNISDVKVKDETVSFQSEQIQDNGKRLTVKNPEGSFQGTEDITIVYSVDSKLQKLALEDNQKEGWRKSLVHFYPQTEQIGWNIVGSQWSVPVTNAHARIIFPDTTKQLKAQCFTGPTNNQKQNCSVTKQNNEVTISSSEKFAVQDLFTVAVTAPAGTFEVPERVQEWRSQSSQSQSSAEQKSAQQGGSPLRLSLGIIGGIFVGISCGLGLLAVRKKLKLKQKKKRR
jgi:hypothetical protein